jgi:3-oxoadipate enol-lactonase
MWDGLFEPLAERSRVVRIDLRGYGRSPLPGGPFSNVEDVRAVVDRLDLAPAALVGASFGGRIALDLALTYPERVSALVLLAPALGGWVESEALELLDAEENRLLDAGDLDRAVELNVRAWVDGPGRGPDVVDPAVRARVGEMQRRAFETNVAAYEREPPPGPVAWPEPPAADRLADVRVPTLVVVGDRDFDDFRAIADRLVAEVPDARLTVLEDAAHMLALERSAEVRQLIDEFLAT